MTTTRVISAYDDTLGHDIDVELLEPITDLGAWDPELAFIDAECPYHLGCRQDTGALTIVFESTIPSMWYVSALVQADALGGTP